MKEKYEKKLFQNIRNIDMCMHYDEVTQQLARKVDIKIFDIENKLWNLLFRKYVSKISPNDMDSTFSNVFIDSNEVNSMVLDTGFINIENQKLGVKNLKVFCKKGRFLNISYPNFNLGFLPQLCNQINNNISYGIIDQYLSNQVDTIIIYPSDMISEIKYYTKLSDEGYENVLSCFNFKKISDDEKFLELEELIIEIIDDFYDENKFALNTYYKDNKKLCINFSNNKNIIIYDMELVNSLKSFTTQVQNDLIDIKTKNVKRKVYKYGTNNNGKNGESM